MSRNCVWIRVHLVWGTKNRLPLIRPVWRQELYRYIGGIIRNKGGRLLSAGGWDDHIHLYVDLTAKLTVSALFNSIKANSSRWVRSTQSTCPEFSWQRGYAVFSVNPRGDSVLRLYISNQEQRHRSQNSRSEYLRLLSRYGFESRDDHFE
jgi:putative transposase